jgi:hypothetical protein
MPLVLNGLEVDITGASLVREARLKIIFQTGTARPTTSTSSVGAATIFYPDNPRKVRLA